MMLIGFAGLGFAAHRRSRKFLPNGQSPAPSSYPNMPGTTTCRGMGAGCVRVSHLIFNMCNLHMEKPKPSIVGSDLTLFPWTQQMA
jgi:hypothetical protein